MKKTDIKKKLIIVHGTFDGPIFYRATIERLGSLINVENEKKNKDPKLISELEEKRKIYNEAQVTKFWSEKSEFVQRLKTRISSKAIFEVQFFEWNGANLESERLKASHDFSNWWNKNVSLSEDEHALIVCHSHGGNVIYQWLFDSFSLDDKTWDRIKIVTLGTPFVHARKYSLFSVVVDLVKIFLFTVLAMGVGAGVLSQLHIAAGSNNWILLAIAVIALGWLLPKYKREFRDLFRQKRVRKIQYAYKNYLESSFNIISDSEDEAIVMLKNRSLVHFDYSMIAPLFFLVITPILICLWFFLLNLETAPFFFKTQISDFPRGFSRSFFLFADSGLLALAISLFILAILVISTVFLSLLSNKFLSIWLTKFLRNRGFGNDRGSISSIEKKPDFAVDNWNFFDESKKRIEPVLSKVRANANNGLAEVKSELLKSVQLNPANLMSVLEDNPTVSKALIHSNYFIVDMADFIYDICYSEFD